MRRSPKQIPDYPMIMKAASLACRNFILATEVRQGAEGEEVEEQEEEEMDG